MKLGTFGSVGLVAAVVVACGGSGGLEGSWTYNAMITDVAPIEVTLNGDGSASYKVTANGSCSGTGTISGYSWKSTSNTLTLSGNGKCTGTFTCTILGVKGSKDCSSVTPSIFTGTCDYVLSSDGNTLTIDNCKGTTAAPDGGGDDAGSGASTAYTWKRAS